MLTYDQLGSSADKDAVHSATKNLHKGLFPGAFCFIAPDIAGDENYCYLKHTDGAGSKVNVAYMATKEGFDLKVWQGIAQDSLVMNIDDMASVGAVDNFQLTNCIDRNAFLISDEAMAEIIIGYKEAINKLSKYTNIFMCGGETADTGNNVRTIVVNSDVSARMEKAKVIDASKTKAGDILIGFASYGQAMYENTYNSGISSNGFTLLVNAMLNSTYKEKYPETFAPQIKNGAYSGKFTLQTKIPHTNLSLGEAMLSPTRSYLPLIKNILAENYLNISGIFNCTGGGLTKPIRFGNSIKYVMNNMIDPGHFFRFVYDNVKVEKRELYKTFNMGCRLIIACKSEAVNSILVTAKNLNIQGQIIGQVEPSSVNGSNQIAITDPVSKQILLYQK